MQLKEYPGLLQPASLRKILHERAFYLWVIHLTAT